MDNQKTISSKDFCKIRDKFYVLTMKDFKLGLDIEEAEFWLSRYEEMELYEECQGILDAINEKKRSK